MRRLALLISIVGAGYGVAALSAGVPDLLQERHRLDQAVWAPEVAAQRYETRFIRLWDQLRTSAVGERVAVLQQFPLTAMVPPVPADTRAMPLGIRVRHFSRGETPVTAATWRNWLKEQRDAGYRVVQTEWHHKNFVPPNAARAARSEFTFEIDAERANPPNRVILRGALEVEWQPENNDGNSAPVPARISVKSLDVLERHAAPAFREITTVSGTREQNRVLPLLVYDLNRDGLPEVILGGLNRVAWNRGEFKFDVGPFLPHDEMIYDAAVMADFTGDGNPDVVAVDGHGYPLLFRADAQGRFTRLAWHAAEVDLKFPKSFTAGDIDGDGDLDLFIANYKNPYSQGQMPTPYYDANDGYPAYLLENDGHGRFRDITANAGLAAKRYRRTYSSSFVDIDDDGDLDLVVISDFAGVDVYLNDGHGHFHDVTDRLKNDRHFFGMGHTFGDYDRDGRLDMYVTGMSSTTARRLDAMNLRRPGRAMDNAMRGIMGYGNRMFLARANGLQLAPFNDSVARTGWSWGASSFDLDNDGYPDIFVANGHRSGKSALDYCSTFWRHDVYVDRDGSRDDPLRNKLYQYVSRAVNQGEMSWNGFEHKVLLWNQHGAGFVNIAFLLGLAMEYDGRAVVATDLDADGRVDLLIVEFPRHPDNRYVLHVYRNELEDTGNWVGVRLHDHPYGFSTVGANVTVTTAAGRQVARIVNGDSFSSQHPATVHFGLGSTDRIDRVEVRWLNGLRRVLYEPQPNRYHTVEPTLQNLVGGN